MKRLFLFSFCLLFATRVFSQSPPDAFKIHGHIAGMDKGIIFFSYPSSDQYMVDSVKVNGGNFKVSGKISEPVLGYLRLQNNQFSDHALYIFLEPTEIKVELSNKPFAIVSTEGSRPQTELMEWKNATNALKQTYASVYNNDAPADSTRRKQYKDSLVLYNDAKFNVEYDFIKSHPRSYAAAYLLGGHYRDYTIAQLNEIYTNMGDKVQNSSYGKNLLDHIHSMSADSRGTVAADIVAKDYITNSDFTLSKLKGKYVIIDFWGSWCKPCIALLPDLVAEYARYQNKNVAFVSIASDQNGNQQKCAAIAAKMGMTWTNLWQTESGDDPNSLVKIYDVKAFPTTVLIAPDGRILERGEGEYGFLKCKAALETALDKKVKAKS